MKKNVFVASLALGAGLLALLACSQSQANAAAPDQANQQLPKAKKEPMKRLLTVIGGSKTAVLEELSQGGGKSVLQGGSDYEDEGSSGPFGLKWFQAWDYWEFQFDGIGQVDGAMETSNMRGNVFPGASFYATMPAGKTTDEGIFEFWGLDYSEWKHKHVVDDDGEYKSEWELYTCQGIEIELQRRISGPTKEKFISISIGKGTAPTSGGGKDKEQVLSSQSLTLRNQAEVFSYYDQLVARWEKREAKLISSAWDSKYKAWFGKQNDDENENLSGVSDFLKQGSFQGQYANLNGWTTVLVSSVTQTGDKIVVKGFENGSWRLFNEGQELMDGGASFSHAFKDTWVKKDGKFLLTKSEPGAYKDLSEEQLTNLKNTHSTLAKSFKTVAKG